MMVKLTSNATYVEKGILKNILNFFSMLKVNLTETEIFQLVPQERVMEYYLGITPGSDLVTSPFRVDKKPGCNF